MVSQDDVESGAFDEKLDSFEPVEPSSPTKSPVGSLTRETGTGAPAVPRSNGRDVLKMLEGKANDPPCSQGSRAPSHSQAAVDAARESQVPAHRDSSRAQSSTRSAHLEAVKVPRNERRGLLARFCVFAEITNPYDYSRTQKWLITFIVAVAGAAAPMGSSLVLPALKDITATFDSTPTVVNLSVALYMLAMSIFPLWWSSFSEALGRRSIYIVSFALFVVFNVLSAVSTTIGMFIAMRMLSGGASASVQAVGAGTIADVWEVKERGRAMGIFYLGPLCGPLLSPIIGGALAQSLGWRSAQWFLAIFGGCVFLFIVLCLPETLRQRKKIAAAAEREAVANLAESNVHDDTLALERTTTTTKSIEVRTRKYWVMFRRAFIDPLRITLYLQFPAVAITVAYSSVTFGTLYMLNISIQRMFSLPPYSYSSLIIGLLYLPNSAGYFLASIFGGKWVDQIMHREAKKAGRYDEKGRLQFRPEDRMKENTWIGAIMWPCALVVYGWSSNFGVSVAVPLIANFFFGVGSMLVFATVTTMLTEFMPRKASNGVALNNFVRNIWSCIGTVVTEPLIVAITNGWMFTGLAVIALTSGCLTIWTMKRYGDRWRKKMDERLDEVMGE